MGTGLDSFSNPQDIGALYPFVGAEVALTVVAVLLWIAWHVRQLIGENREYARAVQLYRDVGLARVVEQDGTEFLVDTDELLADARKRGTADGHRADVEERPTAG
ncbi:MAG TPA: hypothetical protein VM367_07190 [Pseudonocardia sp.]|jgi:hypothetical protein|nr:hypothetical protein [Pseudonocardia sp.]